MSLIADALKRAQEQRQGPAGRSDAGARRLLTPSGPLRVPTRKGREVPRSLALAGFGLAAAVVVFGLVVILSPRSEIGAAVAWAAEGQAAAQNGPLEGAGAAPIIDGGRPGGAPVQGGAEEGSRRLDAYAGGASNAGAERAGRIGDAGEARMADGGRPGGAPVQAGAEGEATSSFRMTLAGEGEGEGEILDLASRALGAQQAGDLEGAASLYRRALASRPWDPQLHNNLGTVYRALGLSGQAYEAFGAALEADRGYAPAWNNLGLMLEGMGRLEEAVDAYREAILRAPDNGGARVNLANAYQAMGLTTDARTLLEAALRDDPGLPEAHYALARLLEATGDEAGARRHFMLFLNTGRGAFGELEARVRRHIGEGEG